MGNVVFVGETFPLQQFLKDKIFQPQHCELCLYLHLAVNFLPYFSVSQNILARSDKVVSGDVLRGAIDFPSNLSSLLLVCNTGRRSHTSFLLGRKRAMMLFQHSDFCALIKKQYSVQMSSVWLFKQFVPKLKRHWKW